jgi:hypothetical protein
MMASQVRGESSISFHYPGTTPCKTSLKDESSCSGDNFAKEGELLDWP